MKQHKIDKLFQEQLSNRPIEFDDAYWQSAAALLDAQAKGKKRRVVAWIAVLIFFLSVAALGTYFYASKEGQKTAHPIAVAPNSEEKSAENFTKKSAKPTPILNLEKTKEEEHTLNESPLQSQSNQEQANEKPLKNDQLNKEKAPNLDHQFLNQINQFTRSTTIAFQSSVNTLQYNPITGKVEKMHSNPTTAFQEMKQKANGNARINFTNTGTQSELQNSEKTAEISLLEQQFNLLMYPNDRSILPAVFDEDQLKKAHPNPPKSHRWNIEAYAGIGLIANKKANDQSLSHYFGGMSLGYKIQPQISLQIGMGYRQIQANFERSERSRQINYGFGKQDDLYYLQAERLHFLEAPIFVNYHLDQSRFSIGLSIGKLLAAQGNSIIAIAQQPWERTAEENENFQPVLAEARDHNDLTPIFRRETAGESGWLATNDLQQWQVNLLAKYQFAVNRKFNLGIGVEYRLQGDYLKNGVGEYAPFSVQFFTTYRIFN